MSLLFCSWATEGAQENGKEDSESDEGEEVALSNGIVNHINNKIPDVLKKEEPKEDVSINCDKPENEDVKQKPSMFIMWKDPGLDYQSEEESEGEELEDATSQTQKEDLNHEEQNGVTETNGVDHSDEAEEKKESPVSKEPLFFAVWKDPNKEDEYISDSSSEEVSEDNEEEEEADPTPTCNETTAEDPPSNKAEDNLFDSLIGETEGNDDLFNSIAKSVTNQMTTIFCDDEDFDIRRDDCDNDNGAEDFGGDNLSDSEVPTNGLRSRSGSTQSQNNTSDRSHSFSLRPKREKSYDVFSKPKKISKYFDPRTFIDKTLYKTHNCDIRIRKLKLSAEELSGLPPPRSKRRLVEADEDLPLSKRRAMRGKEVKKVKARSVSSITKREEKCEEEKYEAVCKYVKAQCPLCWNFWSLSQPYGQHVLRQTCQQTDFSHQENRAGEKAAKFLTVHQATTKTESHVSVSAVPSLKLISRGALEAGNSTSQVVMSVKEGLEYYHSLVSDGGQSNLFQYISRLGKITLVSSEKQYYRLCRDPLKVAIYLEKKITRCRVKLGPRHLLTRNWVEKYQFFLKLPLHDLFLSVRPEAGFRVLEVPDKERLRLVCLVCSSLSCTGCSAAERPRSGEVRRRRRKEVVKTKRSTAKPKAKVKSKKKKGKKDSKSKTRSESPGIKLQLHHCKKCNRYFKTLSALKSHMKSCR